MITNFSDLARTPLRETALGIAEAGYGAIEIESVISERIKVEGNVLRIKLRDSESMVDFSDFERVFLVGIGKGSALGCLVLANVLSDRLTQGIALDAQNPESKIPACAEASAGRQNPKLEILVGTHPLPSEANVNATEKIIELAKSLTKKDFLLVLICGGGSSLATASMDELEGATRATKALTLGGADILELNTVRKHLSKFKGGGLAKFTYPATVVSLIASDVLGNDLEMVASGPTILDRTTIEDAEFVLRKYRLDPRDFRLVETPKDRRYFRKTKGVLFVSNEDAVEAMSKKGLELGFSAKIQSLILKGEAKTIFPPFLKIIRPREAIIAAGETTVTFERQAANSKQQGAGKGGRNQEAVLGALSHFFNASHIFQDALVMSFASDARDNTEAAGAIGDYKTFESARESKLDIREYLDNHDSFSFFEKTDDLIFAEKKNFNVADLMLVLRE